jgi:hypothetical protein
MKKIGEYTTRGITPDRTIIRIPLFDGRFDTGYRVVSFVIAPSVPTESTEDVAAMLATDEDAANFAVWDFADTRQVAWASSRGGRSAPEDGLAIVDPDNFIVQDLYVVGKSTNGNDINYIITMEKYETTDWMGALTMVRNSAQDV